MKKGKNNRCNINSLVYMKIYKNKHTSRSHLVGEGLLGPQHHP